MTRQARRWRMGVALGSSVLGDDLPLPKQMAAHRENVLKLERVPIYDEQVGVSAYAQPALRLEVQRGGGVLCEEGQYGFERQAMITHALREVPVKADGNVFGASVGRDWQGEGLATICHVVVEPLCQDVAVDGDIGVSASARQADGVIKEA